MTALGAYVCRFHAPWATAHDDYLAFGAFAFLDNMRQPHVFTCGRGVLNTQHVESLVLPVDAVVGTHALLNLVDLAHLDFGDDVRVGNMSTGHTHQVHVATFKNTLGLIGVLDVLGMDDRHVDHFLDPRGQVQEGLRRKRHVGNDVGQGVVRITARAYHAEVVDHAGGVMIGRDALHLLVVEAIGVELVPGNAQAHHEVIAHLGAHRLDHFHAKTHAIFETTAPFILAFVDPWLQN